MSPPAQQIVSTLRRQWFLTLLAIFLFGGAYSRQALGPVADATPRAFVVASVMFVMALTLETSRIEAAFRRPGAALLASLINLGLLPVASWGASRLLPADLAGGVLVAGCVPSTLASAALWTRRAGGNDAVALLVTLITNLACCLATPGWLWLLAGRAGRLPPFGEMVSDLAVQVALPILVAQMLRRADGVAALAARWKTALGVYAQAGILTIVLVGSVRCGESLAAVTTPAGDLAWQALVAIGIVGVLHVVAWRLGLGMGLGLGMDRADAIAVAFSGSQKTLMVGLAIAVEWGGLAVLPMMAYHAVQLLVDTPLADWLRRHGDLRGGG